MSNGMRKGFVWAATAAISASGIAAEAQDAVAEHRRSHALRYAGMIERAYARLHDHIHYRSDAPVSWSGTAVPPPTTGWETVWTDAGVRARYCDGELVVYMGAAQVKGVGGEHRVIQQARRRFLPARERGVKLPQLSWLESGVVVDASGNARTLRACMTSSYSEPLPSGRAALAGEVVDPLRVEREQVSYEYRAGPCPAGEHGKARERRAVTQTRNARNEDVGQPVHGAWESAPGSTCRADYTYYEAFARPCSWYQGEPFNREMRGNGDVAGTGQCERRPGWPTGRNEEEPRCADVRIEHLLGHLARRGAGAIDGPSVPRRDPGPELPRRHVRTHRRRPAAHHHDNHVSMGRRASGIGGLHELVGDEQHVHYRLGGGRWAG